MKKENGPELDLNRVTELADKELGVASGGRNVGWFVKCDTCGYLDSRALSEGAAAKLLNAHRKEFPDHNVNPFPG